MFKLLLLNLVALVTGVESIGAPEQAELLFVGDAMQHEAQFKKAKEIGGDKYDFSECFALLSPEIQKADYAVCNLEVPLGGGPDYSGYPCFSAPDSYAEALRDVGFDMMLTANNHCLDRRDKGARRTLTALDRIGVDHIGTYHDSLQRDSLVPFIKDINGFKVGFLNYTYGTNGLTPKEGMEVSLIDRDKMAKEIQKTKDAGAEILVVAIHWGIEYVLVENEVQRKLADFLVDQGVDLIIGGHPHVVQPMKVVHNEKENKDVLVVYSLGNLISNMKTADTRGGALVRATIKRDENGKAKFSHADYDLFFNSAPYDSKSNFRAVPSWMQEEIPSSQKEQWRLFERGAMGTFDKHNINVERRHK